MKLSQRPNYPYEFIKWLIEKMRSTTLFMESGKYTIDFVYQQFKKETGNIIAPEILFDGNTQVWYDLTDEFSKIILKNRKVVVFDKSGHGNHLIIKNSAEYR